MVLIFPLVILALWAIIYLPPWNYREWRRKRDDRGAVVIEYVILLAFLCLVLVPAFNFVGSAAAAKYRSAAYAIGQPTNHPTPDDTFDVTTTTTTLPPETTTTYPWPTTTVPAPTTTSTLPPHCTNGHGNDPNEQSCS